MNHKPHVWLIRSLAGLAAALVVAVPLTIWLMASSNHRHSEAVVLAPPVASPAPNIVHITATGFSPASITIKTRQTIEWINDDQAVHQVIAVSAAPYISASSLDQPNSPRLAPSQHYSYTFTHTQSVAYHDVDAGRTALVIVQP